MSTACELPPRYRFCSYAKKCVDSIFSRIRNILGSRPSYPRACAGDIVSAEAALGRLLMHLRVAHTAVQFLFDFRILGNRFSAILAVFRQSCVSLFVTNDAGFFLFGFFAATVGIIAAVSELQYVHKRFG